MVKSKLFILAVTVVLLVVVASNSGVLSKKVIYGVNAGGPSHIDQYGIEYQADQNSEGIASDFGKRFEILRVASADDQALYQTERYGTTKNFGYDIPIKEDGDYVLVLKFCEVYFRSMNQKVFNVILNKEHLVIPDLDIFKEVGLATAHDEYVEFQVKNKGKTLVVRGAESSIRSGHVRIAFEKGAADNPKINALYVIKGTIQEVPKLPPLQIPEQEHDEDELDFEEEDEDLHEIMPRNQKDSSQNLRLFSAGKKRIRSGPARVDPWELESTTNKYLPFYGAIFASCISIVSIFSLVKG